LRKCVYINFEIVSPSFSQFLALVVGASLIGCSDPGRPAGEITGKARSPEIIAARGKARVEAGQALASPTPDAVEVVPPLRGKQILFGDLHVHTTYSIDAFMYSLPIFSGEGAHPPADACDFARYCAGLDFFSINDHAEGLTSELWEQTKQSIRQCNAVAGDESNPDLVAFMGWEWTQTGRTPESHFGHKNVVFPGLGDDELPARPISAVAVGGQRVPPIWMFNAGAGLLGAAGYPEYGQVISTMGDLAQSSDCDSGIRSPELPPDCRESADTPGELFRKLDEWGLESLVIPHGLAWGIHAPPGAVLDAQLSSEQHDPSKQRLIEISSGHGNGEEYRDLPEYELDGSGEQVCPEATDNYLPCCQRAGELARERCGTPASAECEASVLQAQQWALDAGVTPHQVFPDSDIEDWLDCDQCRDCFKPAMNLRPGMSAQYGAAISNFEDGEQRTTQRYRWGFISSTDNHAARPATGYKQYDRPIMTDVRGFQSAATDERIRRWAARDPEDRIDAGNSQMGRLAQLFDIERGASFLYPGGIVAAHSTGRDRRSIWDALMRREVYGTSGPRMLLWFDLVNDANEIVPMGGEVELGEAPRFVVRASGAFRQNPGCPEESLQGLTSERLYDLCRDECYFPSDERMRIDAIEVIRIRPQISPDESIAQLIEDPWLRFECPDDPTGCRFEFSDPDYAREGRDSVYYVRALQEPTPSINAENLRTQFDSDGNPVSVDPCYSGYRSDSGDDCLAPAQERAWSSPIYVDHPAARK
jgi:hypothetical protein